MRSTKYMTLKEVEHHITLHALIHAYSKLAIADTMACKLIIVGVTTTTAEAFIRDILRSNKVPANIQAIGIDTEASQLRGQNRSAEYCFFLNDLASVEISVFSELVSKVFRVTDGACVKFMLTAQLAPRFHNTLYDHWVAGLLRTTVVKLEPNTPEQTDDVMFHNISFDAELSESDSYHRLDFKEVVTTGKIPVANTQNNIIFFDSAFAKLTTDYLCTLMALHSKCRFVLHPKVARALFIHETYGQPPEVI